MRLKGHATGAAGARTAPGDPDVTFYVVAYHWGWGVFDAMGVEIDGVHVRQGTTVELYVVNDAATEAIARFPAPIAAAINAIDWDSERVRRDIGQGRLPDPQRVIGMRLEEVKRRERGDGSLPNWRVPWHGEHGDLQTHGIVIPWHGVARKLEPDAGEAVRVVFVTNRPGAYEFVCVVYCGYGHTSTPRDMLFVEAAR